MKILFVCSPGLRRDVDFTSGRVVGAVEQQIFGLSNEFAARGHEVYVVRKWFSREAIEKKNGLFLVNIKQEYPLQNIMKKEDNMLFYEALSSFLTNFVFSIKTLRMIKKIQPDVINISTILLGCFLTRAKQPKVYITHTHDFFLHNSSYRFMKTMMLKQTISKSDAIVAITPAIKLYLENMGFRINKVIPNGLVPSEYAVGNNDGQILYSGKLVKHKRVIDLLEAFSSIEQRGASELVVIGEGPEKSSLKEFVKNRHIENSVRFLPFLSQEKYRAALSRCSVFILPSVKEAFGVVIIEAMACGKPVIARRIPGPADIVTHGYNGFLFENNDELREYLELLISDEGLRKKMGTNARKTVEKQYAFNKIADSYEKLYKSIINSKKARATKV